jgi:hypothetical protein
MPENEQLRRDVIRLETKMERIPIIERKIDEIEQAAATREAKMDDMKRGVDEVLEVLREGRGVAKFFRVCARIAGWAAAFAAAVATFWYAVKGG